MWGKVGSLSTMSEWVVSPEDGAAYLVLRSDELVFRDAERLLETIQPYYPSRQLNRIVIDVRGLEPIPGPVEVLIVGVGAQAEANGIEAEVLGMDISFGPAPLG